MFLFGIADLGKIISQNVLPVGELRTNLALRGGLKPFFLVYVGADPTKPKDCWARWKDKEEGVFLEL